MITADMYVEDLVTSYPEAIPALVEKGLICVRCGEPVWGTLRELAQSKNIQNLNEIIVEINRTIERRKEMKT